MIKELNKIQIDELDELLIHCNNRKSKHGRESICK